MSVGMSLSAMLLSLLVAVRLWSPLSAALLKVSKWSSMASSTSADDDRLRFCRVLRRMTGNVHVHLGDADHGDTLTDG
jgi:hypothetical protein